MDLEDRGRGQAVVHQLNLVVLADCEIAPRCHVPEANRVLPADDVAIVNAGGEFDLPVGDA